MTSFPPMSGRGLARECRPKKQSILLIDIGRLLPRRLDRDVDPRIPGALLPDEPLPRVLVDPARMVSPDEVELLQRIEERLQAALEVVIVEPFPDVGDDCHLPSLHRPALRGVAGRFDRPPPGPGQSPIGLMR